MNKGTPITFAPRPDGPQIGHWVWVCGYIDMKRGQRELCRVCAGSYPNQLVLRGHWRGGEWAYTEVELGLYPYEEQPCKRLFSIRRIGYEPVSKTIPIWEARWKPVKL